MGVRRILLVLVAALLLPAATIANAEEITFKINNEYDETNLAIVNLNEDYFLSDATLAITSSLGPYSLQADFAKIRALITPSGVFVNQVSPADPAKPYGWYFSGTTAAGLKQIKFTDTPLEVGNYTLRSITFPAHLDDAATSTTTTPLWPAPFHELLVLGALERVYSVQDLYDKFPDLQASKRELQQRLLSQIGDLNIGRSRDVISDSEDFY